MKTLSRFAFCFGLWASVLQAASAEIVAFQAVGSSHSASAVFSLTGQVLSITLSNTYSGGTNFKFLQTDVVEGLFFDVAGNPTLTKVSAMVSAGSAIRLNGADITAAETSGETLGVGDVGDAWAYKSGSLPCVSQQYGLGASGFGIFGPSDLFYSGGGLPHQQGSAPNGVDYGLMPLDTTNYAHDGFSGIPFLQSSVVFAFSGFTGSLADISNVRIEYGTSLGEFPVVTTPVPEPATGVLLLVPAIAIGLWRRRRG
jgi:hypothetical protein